uniref:Thioredoxin domain-containing protein n=1 Tax=Davidia involucrata TaxID=16924 RepID=A0A5B7AFF0_DAVIN
MACSLKNSIYVSGSNKTISCSRTKGVLGFCPIIGSLQFAESKSRYMGTPIGLSDQKGLREWSLKAPTNFSVHAQTSICVSRAMRWWEKTLQPNMIEINSAQELVDSLLNSGDRLVIVDFYSPGCGGCKALHPKVYISSISIYYICYLETRLNFKHIFIDQPFKVESFFFPISDLSAG